MLVGVERVGQLTDTNLVPRPQQFYDILGKRAVFRYCVQRLERNSERLAPRCDFRVVFGDMLVAARLRHP